jgi:hypothetical protein
MLLKKSLLVDERNFAGPLVRPIRGDVWDHINPHESDHRSSHPFHGVAQRQTYLEIGPREIFEAARFSTFSTVSAQSGRSFANDFPLFRRSRYGNRAGA